MRRVNALTTSLTKSTAALVLQREYHNVDGPRSVSVKPINCLEKRMRKNNLTCMTNCRCPPHWCIHCFYFIVYLYFYMFSFESNYSQLFLYHEGEISSLLKQILCQKVKRGAKAEALLWKFIFYGSLSFMESLVTFWSPWVLTLKASRHSFLHVLYWFPKFQVSIQTIRLLFSIFFWT